MKAVLDYVEGCSSCGEKHSKVRTHLLPTPLEVGGEYYTHYFVCPKTQKHVYVHYWYADK